jgi:hypothetical protein
VSVLQFGALQATVALEALRGEKTLADLAAQFTSETWLDTIPVDRMRTLVAAIAGGSDGLGTRVHIVSASSATAPTGPAGSMVESNPMVPRVRLCLGQLRCLLRAPLSPGSGVELGQRPKRPRALGSNDHRVGVCRTRPPGTRHICDVRADSRAR